MNATSSTLHTHLHPRRQQSRGISGDLDHLLEFLKRWADLA
jgi:hypothetical protein